MEFSFYELDCIMGDVDDILWSGRRVGLVPHPQLHILAVLDLGYVGRCFLVAAKVY